MVTYNTVKADGLVIRTTWDEYHAGPTELLITIDHSAYPTGKGITDRTVHRLSLQSMAPESMRTLGSLRVVGDWLANNRPGPRGRPENPDLFYAHVSLFFVLAVQEGEKGVTQVLANYACVRPTMARQWVEAARKRGMLTDNAAKCSAGRAFGVLTDRARMILTSQSVMDGEIAA